MPPDEITAAANETATGDAPVPAPPRAVRLVPKPIPSPAVARPALPASSSYSAPAPLPARENRSILERKLAGMYDATEMLHLLNTEVVLQRAKRLHGGGSRQTLRVAAIGLLFTLLVAALGAMSYLQNKLAERGFSRHRADVTASPTPGPAAPAAARTTRSADAAH